MTMATTTYAAVELGATYTNGTSGVLHAPGMDWAAPLTVLRVSTAYGARRYVVADRRGNRGYAFATTTERN